MNDLAIRCDGIAKQYRIGQREHYRTLRDTATKAVTAPFRRVRAALQGGNGRPRSGTPTIWALKDVSLEVRAGEVVGIIGRNGAGKSTLLKILSRITKPTRGSADIYGRVGSLLEVGTGFHPELTGRENVYLNGAILGMRKAEIARKFDEMVAFAEIEEFIDTPVKRYSSGMYIRLAFAVAAHLETEILLVDEVLAVGDAQFQKKCFERMRQVRSGGGTVLFVSHNMAALRQVCGKGIVLHHGSVVDVGEINSVVDGYLSRVAAEADRRLDVESESFVVEEVQIASRHSAVIKTFDAVGIRVRFKAKTRIDDPGLYVGVLTPDYQRIAGLDFRDFATAAPVSPGETLELGFFVKDFPLVPGCYQLELHLKDMAAGKIEVLPRTFPFEVVETPIYNGRKLDHWFGTLALHATPFVMTPKGSFSA